MNDLIDIKFWEENGFLVFKKIFNEEEIKNIADQFLKVKSNNLRMDLSGEKTESGLEKITQIMRPSLTNLLVKESNVYKKTKGIVKVLLGDDAALDFDMIINKLPQTHTPTPWHQDAAYWPWMADKRACPFWIALDDVDKENGYMMYVSVCHKKNLRPHQQLNGIGALQTRVAEEENRYFGEIKRGSMIAHHGHTLHGALGNKSLRNRRAWIINYRSKTMVEFLRAQDYNHLGERKNQTK